MRRQSGGVVILLAAVALGTASAQGKPPARSQFTAGVGAMYGNLAGGDFSGTKAAAGFDANAGLVLRRWQLGLGYDRTNHARADTDGSYVVSNIYFEPRLLFGRSEGRWLPYGALRLGRAMASYQGILGITQDASGYIAGLGAGLVCRVAGRIQADAAAHYARLSHDYGTGGFAAAEKGGRVSGRLGVRFATSR